MENFKSSFIRLSSLLGFTNSMIIASDLKSIELLIITDESSIQLIELKSQMMNTRWLDDESIPLDYSTKLKLNLNAEVQPSSPAIVVDLSAYSSDAHQNSQSTGHLPRPAFSHSIEAILGSEASRNRKAETNKQMARENRHVLDQYEKREKSSRINSAVDSNTTGTGCVVLIPNRSQTPIHQGMTNTATHCLNLQPRNPAAAAAAAVSNTPSQKVGVILPVSQNSSATCKYPNLPFSWPRYTEAHSYLPKPTSSFAPYLASTYAWPPLSINPTVIYGAAAAAAETQQTINDHQAAFNSQDFCSSAIHKAVDPFCSGQPESQVQQSCVAVPPYFSPTCSSQSAHSNESQSKSPQKANQTNRPFCKQILKRSLYFSKDTMRPSYDCNAADKKIGVRKGFDKVSSSLVCIDKECSNGKRRDNETLVHLHREHGLIFNSPTMTKEDIMQGIKPLGTKPTIHQNVPRGMRLCRFNNGECYNAYPSVEHLDAHIVAKHRIFVEHLRPASDTHHCEVCWKIFASKANLTNHKKTYNHFIDDAFKRS